MQTSALLDALAEGLRELPLVRLERLPRMADFAIWATAALWSSGRICTSLSLEPQGRLLHAESAKVVLVRQTLYVG
jgi:hypothetical protein